MYLMFEPTDTCGILQHGSCTGACVVDTCMNGLRASSVALFFYGLISMVSGISSPDSRQHPLQLFTRPSLPAGIATQRVHRVPTAVTLNTRQPEILARHVHRPNSQVLGAELAMAET